jgi:hypothetical protein
VAAAIATGGSELPHLTTNLAFHAQQLLFRSIWPVLGPQGADLDHIKATVAQDLAEATKPEA